MDYLFIIVLIAFQICFLIQLYFTLVIHRKLGSYKIDQPKIVVDSPVSIIICARNEIENLKKNLGYFLNQFHSDFEVVVVNDCSNDGTDWYLRDLSAEHQNLKVVTISDHPRFKHGKKFAVTLGIKASKNENMIFSDADCRPSSNEWLSRMQSNFKDNTEIVLGYSPYERTGGLLNRIIRFETFFTALNYISFALAGIPYMGVGRNLAYKKALFFKGKGFASHMHIMSGDDDLFVNQNSTALNTSVEIHPEAHVWSEPKHTFGAYFSQKLRHQGAGKAYQPDHKKILGLQAGSGVLFYLLLFALIAIQAQWWLILSIYLIRVAVQLFVYVPCFRKLNCADLIWWMPILDFIYYFYLMFLSFVAVFKKRLEWK
ncbi:glycosyltransferase [Daejeonella sp.]|uniref:glycosyltransferase n=1 Tax=Daejeonella sp. TaxID=2805397 RepID=UPI0039830C68